MSLRTDFPGRDDHGEGPSWDAQHGLLWRVDSHVGLVKGLDPTTGREQSYAVGEDVAFVLPASTGELVVGLGLSLHALELSTGVLRELAVAKGSTGTRFNDAKADPLGRVVAGTMSLDWRSERGRAGLFLAPGDGQMTSLRSGLTLGNGLGWDPGRGRFYHVDSIEQRIYVYDYDMASGAYGDRRLFVEVPEEHGLPDGLAVDSNGGVWLALFFKGRVHRYTPDGHLERVIETPTACPTSICFGGPDLRTAFVTSSQHYLEPEQRDLYPQSGAVFTFDVEAAGQPTHVVRL